MKIKLYVLIICFFFLVESSVAQHQKELIDSIKLQLKHKLSDSLRIQYLSDLCWYYRRIHVDSALNYGKKANELAKKTNETLGEAQSYNDLGIIYADIGKYDTALNYYRRALSIRKRINDSIRIGALYSKIGLVYQNTYNLDSALHYNIEALKIFEKKKIMPYILHSKNNIANIFRGLRQYEKALKQHLSISKLRDSIGDKDGLIDSYGNIANLYALLHHKKAEQYYKLSIQLAEENEKMYRLGALYNNYAGWLKDRGVYKKALKLFLKSKKIREAEKNDLGITSCLINIGSLQLLNRNVKDSYSAIVKAKSIATNIKSKDQLSEVYEILSRLKMYQREIDSANYYFLQHSKIQEQIYGGDVAEVMARTEIKYQTEKKEKELLQTKADKAITELKLNKQKQFSYSLIASIGVLILLGYSFIQRNRRKHILAIAKEKEVGLQAIIQAEEKERSRIARELHDGVVQQIGSVILKSRNVLGKLKVLDKPESKALLKNLEDSNQELRNISHQMMPRALNELGIIPAIYDLLDGSLGQLSIHNSFEHFNIEKRLLQKVEITIYRVIQELVHNIIKHSKATEVSVQLFKTGGTIILIVEDNGVGIAEENTKKGIGLLNISSRLDMVNGQVNFEPSPNSGTLVTIKIPC